MLRVPSIFSIITIHGEYKLTYLEFMSSVSQKGKIVKLKHSVVVEKILNGEFDELIETKVQTGIKITKI